METNEVVEQSDLKAFCFRQSGETFSIISGEGTEQDPILFEADKNFADLEERIIPFVCWCGNPKTKNKTRIEKNWRVYDIYTVDIEKEIDELVYYKEGDIPFEEKKNMVDETILTELVEMEVWFDITDCLNLNDSE